MSASMYNSPHTYRDPHPPIHYPPMFAGLRQISFRHILDSKFLALAALLFFLSIFVNLFCIISPFWFKLVFNNEDGTFGGEAVKRQLSIDAGIFFMNWDNLVEINKNNNPDVVPKLLVLAQALEVIGICTLVACLAGCVILVFRRFASPTANFILAFVSSITGILLVLVFVCALIMSFMSSCDPYDTGSSCKYRDNLKWRVIPIYSQTFRMEPLVTPYVKLNWTMYISLIGAILTLAGSVVVWLEAFKMFKKLNQIRYTQLRTARSQYEGDINPVDHGKYVYKPPVMSGPMSYRMEPVTFQGGPYGVPQPEPKYSVGFDPYETKREPSSSSPSAPPRHSPPPKRRSPTPSPSPSPPTHRRSSPPRRDYSPPPYSSTARRRSPSPPSRRGPPSVVSSTSEGPYISREIDL